MPEFIGLQGLMALAGYTLPGGAVQHGPAKRARKNEITFGALCKPHGFGSNAGRTNGMPWDGTCPITEGTVIDAPRPTPVTRANPNAPIWAWDLEKSWAMAQNPFFQMGWLGLSTKLEEASSQVSEADFAGELRLLSKVAYQRYLDE